MIANIFLYLVSFLLVWFGAGLVISSTSKFSKKLKLSPFAFSFVFLGLLTSTPEFSVGLQSVATHKPEIFVGNLLGGVLVLFLVIIPLLAIFGNGINLRHELDKKTLLATLLVIIVPSFAMLDRKITTTEGLIFIFLYLVLLFMVEKKNGIFDKSNKKLLDIRTYSYRDILKIIVGLGIVFVSSNVIVEKTLYFADSLKIGLFYMSLIIVAIGTDLPELTLAIRSVISGKREVAMGDYIGSAAASTFLFGIFSLLNNGEVLTVDNFLLTFIFTAMALSAFYFLSYTKNYISRRNGLLLLLVYVVFVIFQTIK